MFTFDQIPRAITRNGDIPPSVKNTYNILRSFADIKTNLACVYVATLAKKAKRSSRTIRTHLDWMIMHGMIVRYLRKSRSNPKMNIASIFYIVPVEPKKLNEYKEDADLLRKTSVPTAKNFTQDRGIYILGRDNIESDLKGEAELPENSDNSENTNPVSEPAVHTEAPAAPAKTEEPKTPNQEVGYDLSGVPEIMRPVAEYLLRKTGRDALHPEECRIIREIIEKRHMPIRVMKEIDTACERFMREGRNLRMLNFYYLGKALGGQDSRHPKSEPRTGNADAPKSAPEIQGVQEALPEVASEILPVDEAEKIISEYMPAVKKQEGIPAALEELYGKIVAKIEATQDAISFEDYLRMKFPEADDKELRYDYMDWREQGYFEQAVEADITCAKCHCENGYCKLGNLLGNPGERPKGGRPVVMLKHHKLCTGWTAYVRCKHDKARPDPEFVSRVKESGLSEKQSGQTFASYEHKGKPEEIVSAKAKAVQAAKNGTSLILAGKPGTGKTHLATAIALEVMRGGKKALFRTVPDLLEELKKVAWEHGDFFGLRQMYRDIPCLVLDDLGKEKTTDKGMEYLYQIIDYRYKYGMQTIVTTNALDMKGLVNMQNADKVEPLVSRILENGEWVTIRDAENHRLSARAQD